MIFKTYTMEDALESLIDYRGKTPQKSDEGIMTLSAKSVRELSILMPEQNCIYRNILTEEQIIMWHCLFRCGHRMKELPLAASSFDSGKWENG